MPAGIYNAYIEQGADWRLLLSITDVNDAPLDLTGYTGSAQVRASAVATVVLAAPTVTFTVPRTTGQLTLSLTATQTKALVTAGLRFQETTNCIWELYLTAPDGTVLRVLNGDAYISPGGIKP
jgi:hypothetical protein